MPENLYDKCKESNRVSRRRGRSRTHPVHRTLCSGVAGAQKMLAPFDNACRTIETNPSGDGFQLVKSLYEVPCETVLISDSSIADEEDFALR